MQGGWGMGGLGALGHEENGVLIGLCSRQVKEQKALVRLLPRFISPPVCPSPCVSRHMLQMVQVKALMRVK